MKKVITLFTTLALLLSLLAIGASAEQPVPYAFVTVAVKGELVAAQVCIELQDFDNDGQTTVNDALIALHKQMYPGGADAGYASYQSDYGLSMSKLWGDESGMFGYYHNNKPCQSLSDPIAQGDSVAAFVYASADWSDLYTYFDREVRTVDPGDEITLTLMAAGYDENWNPISYPVEGATLTLDGEKTTYVTDAQGKVTFSLQEAGSHVVSAEYSKATIVPPACAVAITSPEKSGCKAVLGSATGLVTLSGFVICAICTKTGRKES